MKTIYLILFLLLSPSAFGQSGSSYDFAIGVIIVCIALSFVLRELFCWYWKINKMIELQQKTTMILFKMYEQNGGKVDWDVINKTIYK